MPRWRFYFNGCKKGAIGIRYPITAERDGETCEAAELALYDEYDHISFIGGKAELVPDKHAVKS